MGANRSSCQRPAGERERPCKILGHDIVDMAVPVGRGAPVLDTAGTGYFLKDMIGGGVKPSQAIAVHQVDGAVFSGGNQQMIRARCLIRQKDGSVRTKIEI